jgi:hypothetical protein
MHILFKQMFFIFGSFIAKSYLQWSCLQWLFEVFVQGFIYYI